MKKYLFLIALLVIIQNICHAQWPKVYGHYTYDAIVRGITTDYDNGLLFVGSESIISNGPFLGYIRKTDINGNEIWKRYFTQNGIAASSLAGISASGDGSLILSGQLYFPNDESNGYVMKLNACGDKEWCVIFDIIGYSLCFENKQLPDGSYMVLAGHDALNYDRIWLYRLSSEGDLLWQKCIEPDTNYFDATGYNLLLTNDSCVLVTGFDFYIREAGSGLGWYSPLWVKFDLEGNQLWDLTWYGDGFIQGDFGQTIQDAAGNYYSAGNNGYRDLPYYACFYKFSQDGIPLKMAKIGLDAASETGSIVFLADSTLCLGGASKNTGITGGYDKYFIYKCDTTGNIIKTRYLPLDGSEASYISVSCDNKIYSLNERITNSGCWHWETCLFKFNQDLEYDSTYTVPRVYDSLCPHAVSPAETIELDCMIVDTEEPVKKAKNSSLKVFPVPSVSQVTVSLPEAYTVEETINHIKTTTTWYSLKGDKTIEVFDLNGRRSAVYELPDGQASVTFEVSGWPAGMYLARLVCKGRVWAQGKIVVAR